MRWFVFTGDKPEGYRRSEQEQNDLRTRQRQASLH
jgi:hypothetical protein